MLFSSKRSTAARGIQVIEGLFSSHRLIDLISFAFVKPVDAHHRTKIVVLRHPVPRLRVLGRVARHYPSIPILLYGSVDYGIVVVGGVIDQDLTKPDSLIISHRNDILPSLKEGLHAARMAYLPSPLPSPYLHLPDIDGRVVLNRLPSYKQKPPRAYQANVGG